MEKISFTSAYYKLTANWDEQMQLPKQVEHFKNSSDIDPCNYVKYLMTVQNTKNIPLKGCLNPKPCGAGPRDETRWPGTELSFDLKISG